MATSEEYVVFLTDRGQAKIASAMTNGKPVNITTFKVSDSTAPIGASMTNINPVEHYSDNVLSVKVDETNSNWVVVECVVPVNVGGFYIREVGLFDDDGVMIAIAKYPQAWKPDVTAGGIAKEVFIRLILEVTNVDCVNISIDPHLTVATIQYVLDTLTSYVKWSETTTENKLDGQVVKLVKEIEDADYAGKIHPRQIPMLTEDHIPSTRKDMTLYVDKSSALYFHTIKEALASLPVRINHNVQIIIAGSSGLDNVQDYDEDVIIQGYRGAGALSLIANDANGVRIKSIKVDKCLIPIRLVQLGLKGSYVTDESTYSLGVYNTPSFVAITGLLLNNLTTQSFIGANIVNSSNVVFTDTNITNYSSGITISTSTVTLHDSTKISNCATGIVSNDSVIIGDPDAVVDVTSCTAQTQILNSVFTAGTNDDSVVLWQHTTHKTGSVASFLIPRLDNSGKIISAQLPMITPNRPDSHQGETDTIRLYVSDDGGSDIEPYNGSAQLPFKTIKRALECVPAMFAGTYEIMVKGIPANPSVYSTEVYVTGFTGLSANSKLIIRAIDFSAANWTNTNAYGAIIPSVYVSGNNLDVQIIGFKCQNIQNYNGSITVKGNQGKVTVENCCFDYNNGNAAIYAMDSYVVVKDIVAASNYYIFRADDRGVIKVENAVTTGVTEDIVGDNNTYYMFLQGTGRVTGTVSNWATVANNPVQVYDPSNKTQYAPGNYGSSQFWGMISGISAKDNTETFSVNTETGTVGAVNVNIKDTLTFRKFASVDAQGNSYIFADGDTGDIRARNVYNASYAGADSDLAELFPLQDGLTLEDVQNKIVALVDNRLELANEHNYKTVLGVISTTATHILGYPLHNPDNLIFAPVGLAGVVNVLMDITDEYELGDYVTFTLNKKCAGRGHTISKEHLFQNSAPVIGKIIKILGDDLVQVIIMRS